MGIVAYIDYLNGANAAALASIATHADAGVHAARTLTLDTQPTATDTMTIGATVYTFEANGALTNVAGHIEIGTTLAITKTNIVNAINHTGTPGTGYAAATTAHPTVTCSAFTGNVATITAKLGGTAGNAIATTETFTAASNVFAGVTLTGGTHVVANVTYRLPVNFSGEQADPLETQVYALNANTAIIAACAAIGVTAVSIDGL